MTGYSSGDPVRILQNGAISWRDTLSLPQRVLTGECALEAPIGFLRDVESDCLFELTNTMCSSNSPFNPLFYIQSTAQSPSSYSFTYEILGNVASTSTADTFVEYYCATGGELNTYVKSTTGSINPPTSTTLFNYNLPSANCQDTCGNDICASTPTNAPTEQLPTRCAWDDGVTRPSPATINNLNCDNTVLDVRYKFHWSGQTIINVTAIVIVGDVPLSTVATPTIITQKFSSIFLHDGNTTSQDNYAGQNTYTRSGRPGMILYMK